MKTLNYMSDGDGRKYLTMKCMSQSKFSYYFDKRPLRDRSARKLTRDALEWLKTQSIRPTPSFVNEFHAHGMLKAVSLYDVLFGDRRIMPNVKVLAKHHKRELQNMVTHRGEIRLKLSGISRYAGTCMRSMAFYGKKGYDEYVFKHEGYFPS